MSRIKSSVKMGQGRRRRGPALASAGQRPVRRASLRLRRSRPAALGPRGLRLAGPRLQGCLAGQGRRHARRRGFGDRRCLACAGALLWPAEVDGTPSAGVRDHRSPARAGAPLWPAEVEGTPAAGVGGPPLPATRGRPAQARLGRRRAGRGGRGLPQPGTRGRPRSGPPRLRASTRLKREGR